MTVRYTLAGGSDHEVTSGGDGKAGYATGLVAPGEQTVEFYEHRNGATATISVTIRSGYETDGFEIPTEDASVRLELSQDYNPHQDFYPTYAHVNVSRATDGPLAGVVTLWDDTPRSDFGEPFKLGSGRVNEYGDVVIRFPVHLALDSGTVYARYVPDDEGLVITLSEEKTYRVRR